MKHVVVHSAYFKEKRILCILELELELKLSSNLTLQMRIYHIFTLLFWIKCKALKKKKKKVLWKMYGLGLNCIWKSITFFTHAELGLYIN